MVTKTKGRAFKGNIRFARPRGRTESKGPTIPKMAENLARDLNLIIGDARRRGHDERESVLSICRSNECGFFEKKRSRCLNEKCGCFLKVKTWFRVTKCPIGMW